MEIHLAALPVLILSARMPGLAAGLIAALGLSILYAIFAAIESAFPRLDDDALEKAVENGDKKARSLLFLAGNPRSLRLCVRAVKSLSLFFAAWLFMGNILRFTRLETELAPGLAIALAVVLGFIFIFFFIIFATVLPAQLGSHHPEGFSRLVLPLYHAFAWLLKPYYSLAAFVHDGLLRSMSIDPNEEELSISQEELRDLLDKSKEEGKLPNVEQLMLENVFEFGDKTVSECMTHRMDLVACEIGTTKEALLEQIEEEKFTRMPVYREDIDHICGVLHTRDLLIAMARGGDAKFSIEQTMREAFFTPESAMVASVFREMQLAHTHMAVVIDEYGGTAGVITMEDLLEQIVGQIQDEFDEEEPDVQPLGDQCWLVEARTSLDEVNERTGLELPSEDFDTMAGFVLSLLDRIPDEDEHAEVLWKNLKIRVDKMTEKRIDSLLVFLNEPVAEAKAEAEIEANKEA